MNNIKEYLMESINLEGWPEFTKSPKDEIACLRIIFELEHGWSVSKIGFYNSVLHWIEGLPSSLNIEFGNYEIIQWAKSRGKIFFTDDEEGNFIKGWFKMLATNLVGLFLRPDTILNFNKMNEGSFHLTKPDGSIFDTVSYGNWSGWDVAHSEGWQVDLVERVGAV